MTNDSDYVTVKFPKELASQTDQIIQSGMLGYRAELILSLMPQDAE